MTLSARALARRLQEWRGAGHAYLALANRIGLLISDGGISPGTRLPAERELAAELGVSRSTVAAAYRELRDGDLIQSTRGSGSVARLPSRGSLRNDLFTEQLDLSRATMPALPRLLDAYTAAVSALPHALGDPGFDPIGRRDLRQAIADRYTDRGLPTHADQIMVTIGAQHAISLIARTLLRRGDRVLVENPTYSHAIDAFSDVGARMVGVAVDAVNGWDELALGQVIGRGSPALAYLMPANHNPTGQSMPKSLLEQTLADAAAHGTTVVIDETMAELTLDGPNPLPAALYGPAILLGSVGKTLWGGIRVGWIRAEAPVIHALVRARFASDLGTPVLEQLVVRDLLPDFDQILDERIRWLRAGREHLLDRLRRDFPEWHVPLPHGGLTAWVGLGAPVSSQLVVAARSNGLTITAGPRFSVDGAFDRFLRIPYSNPIPHTDAGLDILRTTWDTVIARPGMAATADELVAVV
jgi:DNA-binding transcriptional MocR family regulator